MTSEDLSLTAHML